MHGHLNAGLRISYSTDMRLIHIDCLCPLFRERCTCRAVYSYIAHTNGVP